MRRQTRDLPKLLRQKQPVVKDLARELKISRWHIYGLLDPHGYPDAIPAGLFDVRSDVAQRIADYLQLSVDDVRTFYASLKAA